MAANTNFTLEPFDSSLSPAITIDGEVATQANQITITYQVNGQVDDIRWPNRTLPDQRADELWKTTCFELFVQDSQQSTYWEFNFASDGYYNCYRFSDYRRDMQTESCPMSVTLDFNDHAQHKTLVVTLATQALVTHYQLKDLRLGVSCVIEQQNGDIHYYALTHCGEQPDFHLNKSYILSANIG